MTAPNDGARSDARKRHDAPTCLVCGNAVPVDASALAAAKAEGRAQALAEIAGRRFVDGTDRTAEIIGTMLAGGAA